MKRTGLPVLCKHSTENFTSKRDIGVCDDGLVENYKDGLLYLRYRVLLLCCGTRTTTSSVVVPGGNV